MQKERLVQGDSQGKARLIGIGGAGTGVGCTHFSVMLLNYLTGFLRRKAVLLEWNETGDFERLEKVCTGICEPGPGFRVLEADYRKRAGREELQEALSGEYEDILMDFGSLDGGDWAEFLRCDKQFLLGSFSEWQQEVFRELALPAKRGRKRSWVNLAVFGSEETRREFLRRYRIPVERIPFSADAFAVTKECGNFFERLLRG